MTTEIKKRSAHAHNAVDIFKRTALSLGVAAALYPFASVNAQVDVDDAREGEEEILEEIIVTGIRQTYRDSLDVKRDATTIVDALSSRDIGALPDNSVAESLERVTGVAGDRFKGNASEISIRGMGPFLGSSTFNGRPISSGSGSRAVAFAQFPSELVNGVVVYKAQQADIREGGVSGTVDLQSIKPLEYGKRRIAMDIRGNYNEYDAEVDTGWGQRGSISYVDVFETDNLGEFGFAIGYAGSDTSTPERSFNSSSNLRDCDQDISKGSSSTFRNCEINNYQNANDPDSLTYSGGDNPSSFRPGGVWTPGVAGASPAVPADNTVPFYHDGVGYDNGYYFVPNLVYWRAMESEDERDAWLTAVQWQPNEKWDINIDAQYSDRTYYEDRKDLYLDDGRRRLNNVVATVEGALLSYDGESSISSYGDYRVRGEIYQGAGLNVKFMPSDTVTVEFDAASSDTTRKQSMTWARIRSGRYDYNLTYRGEETFPELTLLDDRNGDPLDLTSAGNNPQELSFYDRDMEARLENFQISDEIESYKLQGDFVIDSIISKVSVGVDWSEHHFIDYNEDRKVFEPDPNTIDQNALSFCADEFIDDDYGSDTGASITSWWTFDTHCANARIIAGDSDGDENDGSYVSNPASPSSDDIDMTETVTSVFALAEFMTEFGSVDVAGNFGVRYISTEIESLELRRPYATFSDNDTNGNPYFWVAEDDSAAIGAQILENDFTNVLPSLNLSFTFSEELQVRFAAYQALSRPDMWYMGAGRELDFDSDEGNNADSDASGASNFTEAEAIAYAQQNLKAVGSAQLEALQSTNLDLSASYFFSEDTALTIALYTKDFEASYGTAALAEIQTVNGDPYEFIAEGQPVILEDSETISGVEVSFQSVFTFLPEPFDGLGTVFSYNFADSSFETPENGSDINEEIEPLIAPSNLAGLSENVFSGQIYYENDVFSTRVAYKYRSEYLKPFGNDLAQTNRIVDDTAYWDFDMSYEIIDNLKVRFQALNFTNEPYVEQRVVHNAYNRIEYGGARYFLGLQYRIY